MKLFTLNFLKESNEYKKNEINTSHNESRQTTLADINVVNSLQHTNFNNLPASGKQQASDVVNSHKTLEDKVQNAIDNVDRSDPSTEIQEVQSIFTALAIKASLNKKLNEIFASHNMPASPDMIQAVSTQDSSLAQNKKLTNQLIDCVKADLIVGEELSKTVLSLDEICEKKGISKEDYIKPKGLVEDYANPSLEMPSYMDPEE